MPEGLLLSNETKIGLAARIFFVCFYVENMASCKDDTKGKILTGMSKTLVNDIDSNVSLASLFLRVKDTGPATYVCTCGPARPKGQLVRVSLH